MMRIWHRHVLSSEEKEAKDWRIVRVCHVSEFRYGFFYSTIESEVKKMFIWRKSVSNYGGSPTIFLIMSRRNKQ